MNKLLDSIDETHDDAPVSATLIAMDGRLRYLARAHQRLNRVIGRALTCLRSRDGFIRLGYANLETYVKQTLGISSRHAQELAWMEEALRQRPLLDAAYEAGNVTFTAMRLILRQTTVESDVAFAEIAPRLTVRDVQAAIDDFKRMMAEFETTQGRADGTIPVTAAGNTRSEDDSEGQWFKFHANPALIARWYTGLELARRLAGAELPAAACFETWAAEFLNGEGADALRQAKQRTDQDAVDEPWQKQWRRLNRVFWQEVERDIVDINDHRAFLSWDVPSVTLPAQLEEDAVAAGIFELDNRLRCAVRLTHRVYDHLQRGLLEFARTREHLQIDFVTVAHYATERLGMSPSTARNLLELERHLEQHERVRKANRNGDLTSTQADLILRIVNEQSERRWIAHARQTTVRFLKEDVEFAERLRDQDPDAFQRTHGLRPGSPCAVSANAPHAEDENTDVRVDRSRRRSGRTARTCASASDKIVSFRKELANIFAFAKVCNHHHHSQADRKKVKTTTRPGPFAVIPERVSSWRSSTDANFSLRLRPCNLR